MKKITRPESFGYQGLPSFSSSLDCSQAKTAKAAQEMEDHLNHSPVLV